MTEQSNICEICGGVKSFYEEVKPDDVSQKISTIIGPKKLCYGHPKGAPKHDGKLGDDSTVRLGTTRGQAITLSGYDELNFQARIGLDAKQAISLLSWLEQNKPELIALAEQEQS
jgi:hypothetical protein